jgi:hypothetical protein
MRPHGSNTVTVFLSPWLLCHVSAISGVFPVFHQVWKHVLSHMTAMQHIRHVIHVTITHQVTDVLPPCSTYCSIVVSASQHLALLPAQLSKLPQSMPALAVVLQLIVIHIQITNGCSYLQWLLHFPLDIYCS